MKLISWNCCLPPWSFSRKQRLPSIISTLLEENPDLICLQEVFSENDARYIIKRLSEKGFAYSFKFQNLQIISKYHFFFSYGKKFDDQGSILSFSILDALYGKAFQIVGVQINDHKIFIANVHLLSANARYCRNAAKYQNTRVNQIKEICAYLRETNRKNVILVGDFNFEPGAKPYNLVRDFGFFDLSSRIPKTTNWGKIDYIFHLNKLFGGAVLRSRFVDFSDHSLLVLEL